MPNCCLNTIVVCSADLSKFKTWLGDGKALLSKIAPTPQALLDDNGSRGLPGGWYDWRVEKWGTKWDVDADITVCSDTEVNFSFDSAWGPPTRAMQTMGELFPDISIRHAYLEEGECFVGVLTVRDGAVSDICHTDPDTDAWKQMAVDEFGWEPWDDDSDGVVTEPQDKGSAT